MAEADRPSLTSTAWSGRTYGTDRQAAASFRAPAREVASHAGLGLGLCHEAHDRDIPVREDEKGVLAREDGSTADLAGAEAGNAAGLRRRGPPLGCPNERRGSGKQNRSVLMADR